MEKEILVRRARSEDLVHVYRIESVSFEYPYSKGDIDALFNIYRDSFFVAEYNKLVIGYIIGRINRYLGHIISIAVDPSYRRRGIGTKLLLKLIDYFKRHGVRIIRLEVSCDNYPAISLYRKIGFHEKYKILRYYPDGKDCYVMFLFVQEHQA